MRMERLSLLHVLWSKSASTTGLCGSWWPKSFAYQQTFHFCILPAHFWKKTYKQYVFTFGRFEGWREKSWNVKPFCCSLSDLKETSREVFLFFQLLLGGTLRSKVIWTQDHGTRSVGSYKQQRKRVRVQRWKDLQQTLEVRRAAGVGPEGCCTCAAWRSASCSCCTRSAASPTNWPARCSTRSASPPSRCSPSRSAASTNSGCSVSTSEIFSSPNSLGPRARRPAPTPSSIRVGPAICALVSVNQTFVGLQSRCWILLTYKCWTWGNSVFWRPQNW